MTGAFMKRVWSALHEDSLFDANQALNDNPRKSLQILERMAQAGNLEAQMRLGGIYWLGAGQSGQNKVLPNIPKAILWFTEAAKRSLEAKESIWQIYLQEGDHQAASKALKDAAKAGIANSQRFLGDMYLTGSLGFPQNHHRALEWMRKASKQGDNLAQFKLAMLYADGMLGKPDFRKAYMWLVVAASIEVRKGDESRAKSAKSLRDLPEKYRRVAMADPQPGECGLARDKIAEKLNANDIKHLQNLAEKCILSAYGNFD